MKQEQPLGIAFARMAHRGVPAAAAVDLLTPGDRVVDTHLAAGIGRFIERCQNVYGTARVGAKVVPFVGSHPNRREPLSGGVTEVLDMDGGALDLWVASEIGADEPAIPGPLVLGVACRVDADEAAAGADIAFESGFLVCVEDGPGGTEEYDDLVSSELRIGETRGILRAIHGEGVFGAERLDGGDPVGDRVVTKSTRLREDEHSEPRLRALRRGAAVDRRAENREHDQQPCEARSR